MNSEKETVNRRYFVKKMSLLRIILNLVLITGTIDGSQSLTSNPIQKITIMASQAKPYVYEEKRSFRGLDVDIIENFAKKHNLKTEYVSANEPLRSVFNSEDRFNNFSQSVELS